MTLDIHALTVSYGDRRVLHDLNLHVEAGEVLAVIGPNGAGKTTLIQAVSGVVPPQQGTIQAQGERLTRMSPQERACFLAVVPQAGHLPAAFTTWQTVALGRTPYIGWLGRLGPADRDRIHWALARTKSLPLADRPIRELSGGEQQLVMLARALVQHTPILLLDEPTAHLDLHHQSSLLNLVRELAQEHDLAVLMALHDLNLVSLYAHRVALLVEGRLQAVGTPEEVLTPGHLSRAYGVPVDVIPHPEYGTPLVVPDGSQFTPVKSRPSG
jgi:iron complex transport system ATP-binding protein